MAKVKIVIGSNYGDEGKGLMTDYFCNQAVEQNETCIVVCNNGGAQRGHTVTTPDGIRHVFHHFGSGTFTGADTYLSEYFIVNPIVFREEWEELVSLGYCPKVYVNSKCLWTTPFEMMINQMIEEQRGEDRHGSCGMGIWETIVRANHIHMDLDEIINKPVSEFREMIVEIYSVYMDKRLSELQCHSSYTISSVLIERYIDDFNFFLAHITLADDNIISRYDTVVFEHGQGLLLDQNNSIDDTHTTPSNTGVKNAYIIVNKVLPNSDVEICYVTRTYMTRHGAGPLELECSVDEINPSIVDLTNQPNKFQGSLRYGKIDSKKLRERIIKDSQECNSWKKSLAITHRNETKYKMVTNSTFKELSNLHRSVDIVYSSNSNTRLGIKKL